MKLNCYGLSDRGLIRSNNQDSYCLDPEGRYFIVADGMGGHAGGEEASRIAIRKIQEHLSDNWYNPEPPDQLLEQAVWTANEAILQDQQNHPERADMGTTVVAVIFHSHQFWIAHVGDSRLYLLRMSHLNQITEDHTWVARSLKIGDITPEEARVHPFRHVLSRCLGRDDLHQIDVQPLDVEIGDRLLLCTDGLTEELDDQSISDIMINIPQIEQVAVSLIEAAKSNGGHDNITVILIDVEENS